MPMDLDQIEARYTRPSLGGRDYNGKLTTRQALGVACAMMSGEQVADDLLVMARRTMRCLLARGSVCLDTDDQDLCEALDDAI